MASRIVVVAAAIAAMASLSGCGANAVIQRRQAENVQANQIQREELNAAITYCRGLMDSHDLDPIRNKVELLRESVFAPSPLSMLVDHSTATPSEQTAILRWSTLRTQCQARHLSVFENLPFAASMDPNLKDQIRVGLRQTSEKVALAMSYLIAGLYDGDLTYADFNKARDENSQKLGEAFQFWLKAIDAQDRRELIAQAQASQRQLEAVLGIAQALGCAKAKSDYAKALCR